jgi:DNA-binding response OmpR family regulator
MSPNVLIVDDDEMIRMNLELVLGLEGYGVLTADSGRSALRIIETTPVDLVVLDILMPGMNGWDTIGKLRARAETRTLPVIALSGDRRDPGRFRRAGFNACSLKGGSLDQFLATIRAALDLQVGARGLWLRPTRDNGFDEVPLADPDAALAIPSGYVDPSADCLSGLPPLAPHAALHGRRILSPRI